MAPNLKAARDYLYAHGTLWERALFAFHFEGASLARLQACLAVYQNEDGGYGHAFEHDIRCPDSHPMSCSRTRISRPPFARTFLKNGTMTSR